MEANEAGTLADLRERRREILDPLVRKNGGRVVKFMGDGALMEFTSARNSLSCALEIQSRMEQANSSRPDAQRIQLRIGINLGDVIEEGNDVYGDGVNVAARLQALAQPGGICISGTLHESLGSGVETPFSDMGEHELKNIQRRVRIWHHPPVSSLQMDGSKYQLALPDKPSIVVLPFDNMPRDPEQEHFADGVVESITAALSRIRAFFVIARNSAFTYKGRSVNVREIGRELGVAYVLEGSVQRMGPRVRITVQLIETAGGAHIWAEKFDGALDDIFDLQDRITEHVAGALQPSIRLAEIERIRRKRPQDLGAYDYAMRAMRHVWVLEKDEASIALDLLDKAIEIDPDYPLALALAAWCWAQRSVYNWFDDIGEAKRRALELADRAANQSADDPLILAVLGAVHTFARHYGAARVMLDRALALDPNSAWVHSRLGWLDVYADRPGDARAHFEKAIRLSPLDPINFNNYVGLASARQVEGDDNAAADLFIRALQERPNAHWINRNLSAALYGAGRIEEARRSLEVVFAAYPNITIQKFRDAMVFSPQTLDRIAAQLRELGLPES
jgi:adenylate cyclase